MSWMVKIVSNEGKEPKAFADQKIVRRMSDATYARVDFKEEAEALAMICEAEGFQTEMHEMMSIHTSSSIDPNFKGTIYY